MSSELFKDARKLALHGTPLSPYAEMARADVVPLHSKFIGTTPDGDQVSVTYFDHSTQSAQEKIVVRISDQAGEQRSSHTLTEKTVFPAETTKMLGAVIAGARPNAAAMKALGDEIALPKPEGPNRRSLVRQLGKYI